MADPNRALFESVVRMLAPVVDELVFVGGCMTGILVTDPAAEGIRPTRDVDAIVDVASYARYTVLADRLRNLGLAEDRSEGAPACRWRHGDVIVDVMPTDERILGFSNRWYPTAINTAQSLQIVGRAVRIVTPALFIATKLEAFHGRGGDDVFVSHDLEDIVAVVTVGQRSLTMSSRHLNRSGPSWPRRCARCSTARTSSKRCQAFYGRMQQVRRADASWKIVCAPCPASPELQFRPRVFSTLPCHPADPLLYLPDYTSA